MSTAEDIAATAALAHEIWNQHFVPIIGQAQVDYMLTTLQSVDAITRQVREAGYEYYLIGHRGEQVGYFALVPVPADASSRQLSKLYLKESRRGRGLGREVVEWIERKCVSQRVEVLWLTVNKHNAGSIAFYERIGFSVVDSIVMDIGNGFVMDDYRMEKRL